MQRQKPYPCPPDLAIRNPAYAQWLDGWLRVGEARREPFLGVNGVYRWPYEPELIRRVLIDEWQRGFSLLEPCEILDYSPPLRFYIFQARGVWRWIKATIRLARSHINGGGATDAY